MPNGPKHKQLCLCICNKEGFDVLRWFSRTFHLVRKLMQLNIVLDVDSKYTMLNKNMHCYCKYIKACSERHCLKKKKGI